MDMQGVCLPQPIVNYNNIFDIILMSRAHKNLIAGGGDREERDNSKFLCVLVMHNESCKRQNWVQSTQYYIVYIQLKSICF